MNNVENIDIEALSVKRIIFLSLFPGLMLVLTAIIFANPYFGINLPLLTIGIIAMLALGNIPTQLFILKFIAWKKNKKIKDIIQYNNKTKINIFILSIIITTIFAIIVFILFEPIENKFWNSLKIFDFIPDWFRIDKINIQDYDNLKIVLLFYYLLNGVYAPLVEEIYFRGYLLPRMNKFGKLAPLVNSILFSIYHFFSPWQVITRILFMTPIIYSVWKNKDIKIGIIVHILLNTVGNIGMLIMVFQ